MDSKNKARISHPRVFGFHAFRGHYQDLIKLYRHSKDCGNQTSLVSSAPAVDKNSNETVIDRGSGARENAAENVEVSSKHSATHGSTKQHSIANSLLSRGQQNDEMDFENVRARNETRARTARAAVGVRAGAWRNRTSAPARRITITTATTATAARTRATTTATRIRVTFTTTTTRTRFTSTNATTRRRITFAT